MARISKILSSYDYIIGVWLFVLPWIFGFSTDFTATAVSIVIGIGMIVYGLFTNFEVGVIKLIPDGIHQIVDISTAALLAVSPWLFSYHHVTAWPHFITGICCLVFVVARGRRRPLMNFRKN
jgi:hypothetical protein